jgi:hypothetical protein
MAQLKGIFNTQQMAFSANPTCPAGQGVRPTGDQQAPHQQAVQAVLFALLLSSLELSPSASAKTFCGLSAALKARTAPGVAKVHGPGPSLDPQGLGQLTGENHHEHVGR